MRKGLYSSKNSFVLLLATHPGHLEQNAGTTSTALLNTRFLEKNCGSGGLFPLGEETPETMKEADEEIHHVRR